MIQRILFTRVQKSLESVALVIDDDNKCLFSVLVNGDYHQTFLSVGEIDKIIFELKKFLHMKKNGGNDDSKNLY